MKKLLLGLTIIFPLQAFAADDSVYTWGTWSQGIQPAAGSAHTALPAPAQNPNVKFRPNENSVFSRTFVAPGPQRVFSVGAVPQIPNVFSVGADAGQGSAASLATGGAL